MKVLSDLSPWGTAENEIYVIVETPKGSRNKFKFDPASGLFELGAPMPSGVEFPFEFGFVPSTLADDGDPLDVLVLMDAPTFVGCLVKARVVGAIEARETEKGKRTAKRNDRLIAVAQTSRRHARINALSDIPRETLAEIEHFFASYNEMKGKRFTIVGRCNAAKALRLVQRAIDKVGHVKD